MIRFLFDERRAGLLAAVVASTVTAALIGCSGVEDRNRETAESDITAATAEATSAADDTTDGTRLVATLRAESGSGLEGEAFFVPAGGDEVAFGVYLEAVSPGLHAVHIHETGDCSAEDASSAGGHWNPTSENHGKWGKEPFHLGDIGNVEVAEDGTGSLSMTTDLWKIAENHPRSVAGKSVVVHASADDFDTQPDGAAGGRIGCGVIEWKNEPLEE